MTSVGMALLKDALIQAGVSARTASAQTVSSDAWFPESRSKTADAYVGIAKKLVECAAAMVEVCTSLTHYVSHIVDTMDAWDSEYARRVEEAVW